MFRRYISIWKTLNRVNLTEEKKKKKKKKRERVIQVFVVVEKVAF